MKPGQVCPGFHYASRTSATRPDSRPLTSVGTSVMTSLSTTDDMHDLTLLLTMETLGAIDDVLACDLPAKDAAPRDLVLIWLLRWSRREDKGLLDLSRVARGTESMTVTVDDALWQCLFEHGAALRMWPDEVASAVVNDRGSFLSRDSPYGTMI